MEDVEIFVGKEDTGWYQGHGGMPFCMEEDPVLHNELAEINSESIEKYRIISSTASALRNDLKAQGKPLHTLSYLEATLSALNDNLSSPSSSAIAKSSPDPKSTMSLSCFLANILLLIPSRDIPKLQEIVILLNSLIKKHQHGCTITDILKSMKFMITLCDLEDWNFTKSVLECLLVFSMGKWVDKHGTQLVFEVFEEIYKSVKGTNVVKKASSLFYSRLFLKYLPYAIAIGWSRIQITEDSKQGKELMLTKCVHTLRVLKLIVPYLSNGVVSKIMDHVHMLLGSKYSLLTRHSFAFLEAILGSSRVDGIVVPKIEIVIYALGNYILSPQENNPVDTLLSACDLLKRCIDKLYRGERRVWLINLPLVFEPLARVVGAGLSVSGEAAGILKQLVNQHLDDELKIKASDAFLFGEITSTPESKALESVCASIDKMKLTNSDGELNKDVLSVVSQMILELGDLSHTYLKGVVHKLAELRRVGDNTMTNYQHLEYAFSVLVQNPDASGVINPSLEGSKQKTRKRASSDKDSSGPEPERKKRSRKLGSFCLDSVSSDKDSKEDLVLRSRIIKRSKKEKRVSSDCESSYKAFKSSLSGKKHLQPRVRPFRSTCIKAIEFNIYNQYPKCDRDEEVVREAVDKEIAKQDQAELASIIRRNTRARILGSHKSGMKGLLKCSRNLQPEENHGEEQIFLKLAETRLDFINTEIEFSPEKKSFTTEDGCDKTMMIKLTGVTLFPEVDGQGGAAILGILEAHSDRFVYTTSTSYFDSYLTCKYENVKDAFVQAQDEDMPYEEVLPLLHLRLHHPIMVGTEKRQHIQFRLLPTNSEKIEKEKQTMDGGRRNDLKDFVYKVGGKWSESIPPFSFEWVCKRHEFHGIYKVENFHGILTFGSLIQLEITPFVVVNLEEIEIINLARLRPEEFDITVVFKNFKCPVLQISSIPLNSLESIKKCLHFMGVKYYDNNLVIDWSTTMKKIADNSEKFIQAGGWDSFKLEDSATSLYYMHYLLELSQADMMNEVTIKDCC